MNTQNPYVLSSTEAETLCVTLGVERTAETFVNEGDDMPEAYVPGIDTPLHKACIQRNIKKALQLIREGADVNAQNDVGNTPLHLAGEFGLRRVIEELIAYGADEGMKNVSGEVPFYAAWIAENEQAYYEGRKKAFKNNKSG